MRVRLGTLGLALAVVAVSCGGGETGDTSTTTSAAAEPETSVTTTNAGSTSTAAVEAAGGETEFCQLMSIQDTAMETVDIFDPASVEKAHKEALEAMHGARDLVPGAIRNEYDTLVSAFEGLVAALEEIGWDFLAISEDDPRLVRMGSDEVLAATNALIDYCGLEAAGSESETQSPDTESGSDLPAELIPAGAVLFGDSGSGINIFSSTASFDEIVAFYESALGEAPVNVDGEAGERVASFLSAPMGVLVQVEEGDEELLIYITRTG